jgi:hypothetical protein
MSGGKVLTVFRKPVTLVINTVMQISQVSVENIMAETAPTTGVFEVIIISVVLVLVLIIGIG